MSTRRSASRDPVVLSAIADDPRHRRLLAILEERSDPPSERELAQHLGAREAGDPPSQVPDAECERLRTALHHRYLPKLASAGLIERRDGEVRATGRIDVADIAASLPSHPDLDVPGGVVLAALLARRSRAAVAEAVAEADGPVAVEDLLEDVASDDRVRDPSGGPVDERRLLTRLHHVDLPKLDEVGLVAFDAVDMRVAGRPPLDPVLDRTSVAALEISPPTPARGSD